MFNFACAIQEYSDFEYGIKKWSIISLHISVRETISSLLLPSPPPPSLLQLLLIDSLCIASHRTNDDFYYFPSKRHSPSGNDEEIEPTKIYYTLNVRCVIRECSRCQSVLLHFVYPMLNFICRTTCEPHN